MAAHADHDDRTDDELTCPVRGCDYTHESPQGLAGHVPSHPGGWDAAEASPTDVHEEWTAGREDASTRVAKVEFYLAGRGVPLDALRVYEHAGYGTVQIRLTRRLSDAEWNVYRGATDVEGVRYVGNNVSYCTEAFVEDLPDPTQEEHRCESSECENTDTLAPVVDGDWVFTLCRPCRKEFWGVSS